MTDTKQPTRRDEALVAIKDLEVGGVVTISSDRMTQRTLQIVVCQVRPVGWELVTRQSPDGLRVVRIK